MQTMEGKWMRHLGALSADEKDAEKRRELIHTIKREYADLKADEDFHDLDQPFIAASLRERVKHVMKISVAEAMTAAKILWEQDHNSSTSASSERNFSVVGIDFEITNLELTHTFDLESLQKHTHNVLTTYYDSQNAQSMFEERYLAPYFCFIQSSGMGKTKLLYEMKKTSACDNSISALNNQTVACGKTPAPWRPIVKLILCRQPKHRRNEEKVFDAFLPALPATKEEKFETSYNLMRTFLDKLVESDAENQSQDVVLLFDEAHYLTDPHKCMEGFWFRVVRLWLRFKRDRRVVAVFAGTKMKMTNFAFDDDLQEIATTDTRENARLLEKDFFPGGKKLFDTFHTSTTTGCLRKQTAGVTFDTEYTRSVPFGRPLFAAMLSKGKLAQNIENILKRMLLLSSQVQGSGWSREDSCCLNILATRVQMGQTTVDIASELVGGAYANLVGVDENRIRIHYPPDPVCARLAMCLMDERWSFQLSDGRIINGTGKAEWAKKISILFSNRIFAVEKGDFGEVLVAFYFLLCADEVRGEMDTGYETFSVPLDKWIHSLYLVDGSTDNEAYQDASEDADLLEGDATVASAEAQPMEVDGVDSRFRHGKRVREEELAASDSMDTRGESDAQGKRTTEPPHEEATIVYFNAVQVCQNYLRGYASSWESLCDQDFLRNIFNAAVGFYVFGGCATIDCVFPLALKTLTEHVVGYLPMFVSIKSHDNFTEGAAKKECTALLKKAEGAKPKHGALCLLVIFGADRRASDKEDRLNDPSLMDQLRKSECVAKVLRIPRRDRFGLSDVFASMTSVRDEIAEILASHCFVGYDDGKLNRTNENKPEDYAHECLRKSRRKLKPATDDEPLFMLSALASQLSFGSASG